MSYTAFVPDFSQRIVKPSEQLANGDKPPCFAHGKATLDDLVKMFDRKTELDMMRAHKGADHTAGQWVSPKSRIEVLAGCERDTRSRYHSRLNSYLGAIDLPYLTKCALEQHVADTEAIIQP